jgi:hypothetical protein
MNLHLEQLEQRLLLAVTSVNSTEESLIIKLDAGDDDVEIVGTGTPNEVDLTINGTFIGTFTGPENIKIIDKGGTNSFEIDAVELGGYIDIKSGAGEDTVDIADSNFSKLKLNLGAGDDFVFLDGNTIHYDSRINTGDGDDEVFIGEGGSNTFGDKLKINTGNGNDVVGAEDNTFQQQLSIKTGNGDDIVVLFGNTHGDDVKTNGGKGDDALFSDGPGIRRDSKKFETVSDTLPA